MNKSMFLTLFQLLSIVHRLAPHSPVGLVPAKRMAGSGGSEAGAQSETT